MLSPQEFPATLTEGLFTGAAVHVTLVGLWWRWPSAGPPTKRKPLTEARPAPRGPR